MLPPKRPSGSLPSPAARVGTGATQVMPVYEIVKARVLVRLHDRLDPAKSRRMPLSLLQQTARQQVEQVIDAEAPRMSRADRDRLAEEVLGEAFGFGPLEELFRDAAAKEIMVLGPQAVVVRREQGWVPTNVKFRDEEYLRVILGRVAAQGEAVAAGLPPSVIDTKLNNGFRAVAVLPPAVLGTPATAVFVRFPDPGTQTHPALVQTGTHAPVPAAAAPPTAGGSIRTTTPGPRPSPLESPAPGEGVLGRYRERIRQRIISKMASLGVFDVSRLEVAELRKVVAAYVEEFCTTENVYLSAPDQGRLTLEILTAMKR